MIYCTYCSYLKQKNSNLLPAYMRYIEPRIQHVYKLSLKKNRNLYFLSGKFGLIPADKKIPYYDKLLLNNDIESIVNKSVNNCQNLSNNSMIFFYDPTDYKIDNYINAIIRINDRLNIKLKTITITDNLFLHKF